MINNMEWLNLNSQRNYPIKENASRKDKTDSFDFPRQLIVDAIITTTTDNNFYIKTLKLYEELVILGIHDIEDYYVGTITVNLSAHKEYDHYILNGQGKYKELQGKITIGDISSTNIAATGSYEFAATATCFEEKVIIPSIKCVNTLQTDGDNILIGDVRLKAGYNARLRVNVATNTIIIDAIAGEGLGPVCRCEEATNDLIPIERINGIRPDVFGNFNLRGIGCISINGAAGGVKVENTCEEPCCDCDEVIALQALIDSKLAGLQALSDRISRLELCPDPCP